MVYLMEFHWGKKTVFMDGFYGVSINVLLFREDVGFEDGLIDVFILGLLLGYEV